MLDVPIPAYYVLGREIDDKDMQSVRDVLQFTPVVCAVIYERGDATLAHQITRDIVLSDRGNFDGALGVVIEIHNDTGRAVLLIGEGRKFTAHHLNGTAQEIVSCS